MNDKKCKKLRKIARRMSVGMPDRELMATKTNPKTAFNNPKTTRGIYLAFKRMDKRAA